MTQKLFLSRRTILGLGINIGATFLIPQAYGAPGTAQQKLVVIICRGALDGLSLSPPIGDANYQALRGPIAITPDVALKLDGDFSLHPKLQAVYALAKSGQARIAPAVAIPQRIRSHFEAQDLLESGGEQLYGIATGWMNRALSVSSQAKHVTALSVGAQEPLILRGPVRTQSWSPGGKTTADTGRLATILQDLYSDDKLLGPAFASGLQTEMTADTINGGQVVQARDVKGFANTAAKFLTADGGPSVAVLSLDGFDTHANQGAANGQLANRIKTLDDVIAGLRDGLGAAWNNTVVIAVTEFGRTAHVNGTGGTDHGTASTMILAGGSLKQGGIVGDWPGLASSNLFESRDLAPTLDVRQVFKAVLIDHMGMDRRSLEETVFPQSKSAAPLAGLFV